SKGDIRSGYSEGFLQLAAVTRSCFQPREELAYTLPPQALHGGKHWRCPSDGGANHEQLQWRVKP
ncbi:hypothetical protein LINPERPRIM_LOCUS2380, partial [Linum perenne]